MLGNYWWCLVLLFVLVVGHTEIQVLGQGLGTAVEQVQALEHDIAVGVNTAVK